MNFNFCPKCGFKFDAEYNFCPKCGYNLNGAGASAPEPLFDFSEDTAKYGDSGFGGFDEQLKNKEQAAAAKEEKKEKQAEATAVDEEEELQKAIKLWDKYKDWDAVEVFDTFANKGNADAQYYLGEYLESEMDYEEAAIWYQKAAEQGHKVAKKALEILKKKWN